MDVEKLARKLEPLMPDEVSRWMRARNMLDTETKVLIEKQIVSTAYRVLGDVRKKILLSLPPENKSSGAIRLGKVVYDKERWPFGISHKEMLQPPAFCVVAIRADKPLQVRTPSRDPQVLPTGFFASKLPMKHTHIHHRRHGRLLRLSGISRLLPRIA